MEAVDFLNEVRAKIGVQPVTLNREVTQAAEAHAKYYNANKEGHPGLDAHSEKEGNEGFTGASVKERIRAAGWSSGSNGAAYGEVMHFKQNSSSSAIQGWLDSAYHRDIILSPRYSEIGIGLADGTAVVDMAGRDSLPRFPAAYPFTPTTGRPGYRWGSMAMKFRTRSISLAWSTRVTSYPQPRQRR
ncbi:hypothetical protein HMSSN036_50260 [Paenibacillus macerans]|nr:hypothetical protein HMSSN036_50260 [Paenibacillus macerans]